MIPVSWLEALVGFVIPTAALIWIVRTLWRSFRPGDLKQASPFLDGVVGFLLICFVVVLVVVGWEMFKSWRRPTAADPSRARPVASALPIPAARTEFSAPSQFQA